ncbi:MAG: Trk system potassium transporter TrkA [bacterium]
MLEVMYAVIVGAGEVGFHIATILSQEGHEVAVVDRGREAYERAAQELDVLAVHGNGASRRVLEQVSMGRADLLVAVTDSDEVNMIACMAAKRVGVAQTIARVRNPDYIEDVRTLSTGFTGVDHVIQPEAAVADEVAKLAAIPGALDVETFAGGQVWVIEIQVDPTNEVIGIPLRLLTLSEGVIVTAIQRDGHVSIPRGDSVLEARDRVFLTGTPEAAVVAASRLSGQKDAAKKAMLLGCGEIGMGIAIALEQQRMHLTVFEKDAQRAAEAAAVLRHSLVLRDEGIDETILAAEGVGSSDLFVAATGDDRLNILAALMAKQMGAKRTVSIVERPEFSRVVESVGVDVAISPRRMTASAILRFVRSGRVISAAVLDKAAGEVLEFVVGRSSPVCGRKLADVHFPPGAIVGAVVSGTRVHIPDGRSQLEDGDVAVVFTVPESVRKVEKLFAPRSGR